MGNGVFVGSSVSLTFFYETLLNKRIEIRVQPTVMDFLFIIIFHLLFDREPVRLIKTGNYVEEVALKPCEVVHISVVDIQLLKYY